MSKNKQKNQKKNTVKGDTKKLTGMDFIYDYADRVAYEYPRFFSKNAIVDEKPPIGSLFDVIDRDDYLKNIESIMKNETIVVAREGNLTKEEYYKLSMLIPEEMSRNQMIVALAKNPKSWKWIDQVYKENKNEYYSLYKETFFYESVLTEIFPTKTKEYINKLAGIDAWCRLNDSNKPIYKIIQKTYNKLYSLFKSGIKEINLDGYTDSRIKPYSNATETEMKKVYEEIELEIVVSAFLAFEFNVKFAGGMWESIIPNYARKLFDGIASKISNMLIADSMDDDAFETVTRKFFDVGIKEIRKCKNLYDFYMLIETEQAEIARTSSLIMQNVGTNARQEIVDILEKKIFTVDGQQYLTEDVLDKSIEDYVKNVSNAAQPTFMGRLSRINSRTATFAGLSTEVLKDMPINEDIIKIATIINCMISNKDDLDDIIEGERSVGREEKILALNYISALSMLEHYKEYKPSFFSEEFDEVIAELNDKNLETKEKDIEIERLKKQLEELEKKRVKELDSVLNDLNDSRKNILKLEKEIEILRENDKEFNAMKELVYRNSIKDLEVALTDEVIDIDYMVKYLTNKKVMVFGGHPNWVNKLKKYLPDIKYVDAEKYASQNFNNLEDYDLLTICTNYIGHGLMYKISEAIKNIQSKKVVMTDDVNTEKVVSTMYNSLIEFEENNG